MAILIALFIGLLVVCVVLKIVGALFKGFFFGAKEQPEARPVNRGDIENLMLMCHECHTKIDQNNDGGRYSGELLIQWKKEHERRIELITGINPSKKSTVIHYKAPIGNFSPDWDDHDSLSSLFPLRYPERDYAIDLSAKIEKKDSDENFYKVYKENLDKVFSKKIISEVEDGDMNHLSIFAMAPQPLLIYLGKLLGNIAGVEVYQRHRIPDQSWKWPESNDVLQFKVKPPELTQNSSVALLISLSADINESEVESAMGTETDFDLWKVFIDEPSVHYMSNKASLHEFYKCIGKVFDDIKKRNGEDTKIHLFPVMSNSCAVETGRSIMQNTNLPITVYNKVEIDGQKKFIPTISI